MENRVKEFEEVRKAKRKVQNNTTCRFDSQTMEFSVYELSAHGFSFLCGKESCFFKRGAILDRISVLNSEKMEIINASGTVMHLADFDFDNFRVGVSYTKKTLDRTISGKVRVPRLTPKIRLDVEISLKHDGNGLILAGHVMDYTASTSRVKFIGQQPVDLKVGDEVKVHIKAEEKTLFDGDGYVFRTRDEGSEIVIRFMNKFLDVSKVEKTSNAFQNRSVVFSALTSLKNYTDVKDNFKALICDWRLYLNRLKQVFDQEEGKNIYRTDAEQELFLKGIEEKLLRDLHDYIYQMNDMVENLKKNESSNYKKYYRENLNPLLRFSPLISSIIDKDLGYAGDYETIKQFFQNPYSGDTLFGKFVNKYLCSLDAVMAHQDRIQYLIDQLNKAHKESKGEFSFLSLGSGPAEEVLRFVEKNVFEKPVRATLLDMDAYALADFSARLQYLPKENFVIELLNVNILNIIREKEEDLLKGKYQMAYCAGLFDYFSEAICKRLVKFLITHTESEGVVVITNVHKKNRARHVMEYCGGWEIVHRDEKEMAALVPPECKFEFGYDKTGANIFLRIFPLIMDRVKKIFSRRKFLIPDEFVGPYKSYLHEFRIARLTVLYIFGGVLIPAAFFFDVLIYPEKWFTLFKVRLISLFLCTLMYVLSKKTVLKNYPIFMCHILNIVVSSTIVYLVVLTGSYASPYYAGLILLFICMAMVMPLGLSGSVFAGSVILSIYYGSTLLPSIISGNSINWHIVWNSIYFLTFSFVMATIASEMLENSRKEIFVRTEQEKIRNKILEESRLKIDALLKTKSRFISNITHELKTPLSIVIGNTDIILERAEFIDESIANQLRVIQQAAFQLATHVDRIIAVSTADDPELKMNTDRYDYVGIIRNVFKLFEPKAREEEIQYSLNLPLQSLVVDIDVVRIEEVLNNLIQNAFKFTEGGGGITVTVSTDGQTVFTEVSDTGVGIPENQHNEIFERLYQADEVLSKRHGGIGIGLYLCKRNIELHGGTITVHSRVGKGSSFKFSIPLFVNQSTEVRNKPYAGPEQRAVPERRTGVDRRMVERQKRFEYQQTLGIDDLAKMTYVDDISDYENRSPAMPSVLIVEDNPRMMKVIAESLGDEYNLFLAMNGLEALNKLEMNTGHISLILSDVMMPGMSGFDFCKTVMAREEWKGIPVIFVTALLKEEDQLRGFELGATDYIIKPYNIKILREKVAHWISRRQYELLLQDMSASLDTRVKEISRIKDIILHEIRNPLQLIGGADFFLQRMSNTLFKSSGEEERRWKKSLKMLTQGIESIKSVLETSQSLEELGLSSKKPEPVSALFDDAISQCAHLMNNIKLHVDLKVMADRIVLCNKKMMTQVFVNLIRNATEAIRERAPEDGGVIRITSAKEDDASVIFKIRDNGSGITPEAKEQLFRFRFTTKKDGMGVGLHLSKIILKMHEGNITVESEEKVGTTFLISLPLYNP